MKIQQILWSAAKQLLKEKYSTFNSSIRKEGLSSII